MFTVRFYLDCRRCSPGSEAPLHLVLTRDQKRSSIPLNLKLRPEEWNAKAQTVEKDVPGNIGYYLRKIKLEIEAFILEGWISGEFRDLSSVEMKARIYERFFINEEELYSEEKNEERFSGNFDVWLREFASRHKKSTEGLYLHTKSRIMAYMKSQELGRYEDLTFEDIDVKWLRNFDNYLSETSPSKNARNIHFRNIRAVFNDALAEEAITCYPFRKFKIRPEPTRKRSLSLENLRKLFDYPAEEYAVIYRDMFKLIFMLIGINSVDLHRLKDVTPEGRIEYHRAKTGRLYSVKVEPEALDIINKYRGKKGLLCVADRWSDHRNFRHQMNNALQNMGTPVISKHGKKDKEKKGEFPELSTYWARHTWATIAASLDIPKETIAAGLGHGGNTVTDIYIDFDQKKVDEANRKVMDWVLYGKK